MILKYYTMTKNRISPGLDLPRRSEILDVVDFHANNVKVVVEESANPIKERYIFLWVQEGEDTLGDYYGTFDNKSLFRLGEQSL